MRFFNFLQQKRKENILKPFDLVYLYLIGGLIGTIYEEIFYLITINKFVNSSGSVILPFNMVYGLGIVLITFCFYQVSNWLLIWLFSGILCGTVEFISSFLSEKTMHVISWDYSDKIMNLNGRTTIPLMVLWGLAGMVIIVLIVPFLLKLIHKIPNKIYNFLALIFLVMIVFDLVISFLAVFRYSQRYHQQDSNNEIMKLIDKLFDDNYMKEKFPNLKFIYFKINGFIFIYKII